MDEKSAHHHEAYHYTYTDEPIGQMWNVLQLTRILLRELIFSRCPKPAIGPASGSGQSSLEYYATTTIDQMSREICATVPQYIGSSSKFLLQGYYTYRSPASRICPKCTNLASKRKAACTPLQAHLSTLCCSTIADCLESDQAVRNSTAAFHSRPSRHRECAGRCQNSGI